MLESTSCLLLSMVEDLYFCVAFSLVLSQSQVAQYSLRTTDICPLETSTSLFIFSL